MANLQTDPVPSSMGRATREKVANRQVRKIMLLNSVFAILLPVGVTVHWSVNTHPVAGGQVLAFWPSLNSVYKSGANLGTSVQNSFVCGLEQSNSFIQSFGASS